MSAPCECGRGPRVRKGGGCILCEQVDEYRYRMESVRGKIQAALRDGEWRTCLDIADMADEVRDRATSRLAYMVSEGMVEQRWEKGVGMVYRLKQRRAA